MSLKYEPASEPSQECYLQAHGGRDPLSAWVPVLDRQQRRAMKITTRMLNYY